MAALKIRLSMPKAIFLAIVCSFLSFCCVLIGVLSWSHPDVPAAYLAAHPWRNTMGCIMAIAIGAVLFLVAIAAVRGSLLGKRGALNAEESETATTSRLLR